MSRMSWCAISFLLLSACSVPTLLEAETANARCPMGDEPVLDGGGITEWRGVKVGFCCKKCLPMFEKLSASEQDQAMAAVGVPVGE